MKTLSMLLLMIFMSAFGICDLRAPIMIAVLLPEDNRRPFSMSKVLPAIQIAVEKVQSPSGLLPGQDIQINARNSFCSSADAMNEAISLYIRNLSHIFFGPCCDYAAAPVARQTKYWNVPMITTALARDFAVEKHQKYPMVTRVSGSINKMADFFASMGTKLNWHQMKVIYEPRGLDAFLEYMCHVLADSLHFTLSEQYHFHVPYYKFESTQEALLNIKEEIGTENAGLLTEAKVSPTSDVLHMQILELLSVHDFTTQGGQIPASRQNDNLYERNNTTWDFLLMHTLSPSPARAKSALFLRYTRNANSGIFHA